MNKFDELRNKLQKEKDRGDFPDYCKLVSMNHDLIVTTLTQAAEIERGDKVVVDADTVRSLMIALAHHINADAYASTFPDDDCDHKALKKQETWNRLQARIFISDDLAERCSQAHKEHYSHKWDADGERCVKCGDKDWFNDPICKPQAMITASERK